MALSPLQQSILGTITYFDCIGVAPTTLELQQWLLRSAQVSGTLTAQTLPTISSLEQALRQLPQLQSDSGVWRLRGGGAPAISRLQRFDATEAKWKRVKLFLALLAACPGVEAIWLCNSMGWSMASPQSDIDLCIVTTPGRIWTTRFLTTALMALLRQRPGEQARDKSICLSFYVSTDALDLSDLALNAGDVHFAFWATQMYPVYDPQQLWQRYQTANQEWLDTYFIHHQWQQPNPRRQLHVSGWWATLQRGLIRLPGESLLRQLQWRLFPAQLRQLAQRQQTVQLTDSVLKFHTEDNRLKLAAAWRKRCHNLLQ